MRRKAGQKHRFLHAAIATTHHDESFASVEGTITCRAVVNTLGIIFFLARYAKLAIVAACRNEHRFGSDVFVVHAQLQHITLTLQFFNVTKLYFGTESFRLPSQFICKPKPLNTFHVARIIINPIRRGSQSANYAFFIKNSFDFFAGRVNSRSQRSRTGANHDEFVCIIVICHSTQYTGFTYYCKWFTLRKTKMKGKYEQNYHRRTRTV